MGPPIAASSAHRRAEMPAPARSAPRARVAIDSRAPRRRPPPRPPDHRTVPPPPSRSGAGRRRMRPWRRSRRRRAGGGQSQSHGAPAARLRETSGRWSKWSLSLALESVLSPELSRGRPRSPEIARDHTRLPPDAADGLAARIAPVERVRRGDQPPVGDARDVSWTRRGGAGAADAPRLSSSVFWIAAAARRSASALLVGSAARFACTGRRGLPRRCRRRSSRSRAACSSPRRKLTQAYGAVRQGREELGYESSR